MRGTGPYSTIAVATIFANVLWSLGRNDRSRPQLNILSCRLLARPRMRGLAYAQASKSITCALARLLTAFDTQSLTTA